MPRTTPPKDHGQQCICNYAEAVRRAVRTLRTRTSPSEFCVLMFILDRTYAYNKVWEVIPLRHFTHGIAGITMGSGLSERNVQRSLTALIEKGYIEAVSGDSFTELVTSGQVRQGDYHAQTKAYRIKFLEGRVTVHLFTHELPENENIHSDTRQSDIETPPERRRVVAKTAPGDRQNGGFACSNVRAITREEPGENNLRTTVSADAKTRAEGNLNSIRKKSQVAKQVKLALEKIPQLQSYWFQQAISCFPDAAFAAWSLADQKNFKTLVRERISCTDRQEFIEFVFSHWVEIKRSKFPRLRMAPDYPKLWFVYRFVDDFLDALNTIKAGQTLVAKDRDEKTRQTVRDLNAIKAKAASLERQIARERAAKRDAQQAAQRARSDAIAAAHPGLTPEQIFDLTIAQKNGKQVSGPTPTSDKIKPNLNYTPEEFE